MKKLINESLQKYKPNLNKKPMLTEVVRQYGPQSFKIVNEAVKARIEHPEDVVFTDGSIGAKKTLIALKSAAAKPELVSLKWDGSVAIIFGRDSNGFTLTDKAGFAKVDGMPRSAQQAFQMIYGRKPDQEGRKEYATQFASLFPYLNKILPTNFKGFLQADVLWFVRPTVVDGSYEFKPNKITYRIPVPSELGKTIQPSKFGIAVHSYFKSHAEQVPQSVTDLSKLKLNTIPEIVVLGSKIPSQIKTPIIDDSIEIMYKFINNNATIIDDFLNKDNLRATSLSDLPALMKSFLASKASGGQQVDNKLAKECFTWLKSNLKITEQKKTNITKYVLSKKAAFVAIWKIVAGTVAIKNLLKQHFDKQTSMAIQALLSGQPGHEGFVIDAPSGKVKLVNRPRFMQKEQ